MRVRKSRSSPTSPAQGFSNRHMAQDLTCAAGVLKQWAVQAQASVIHDVTVEQATRAADLGRCSLGGPPALHLFGATQRGYSPRPAARSVQDHEKSRPAPIAQPWSHDERGSHPSPSTLNPSTNRGNSTKCSASQVDDQRLARTQ